MQETNPLCRKGFALTSDNQCQKGSALTSENQCQKGSALISDNRCQIGSKLIFNHARNQSFMPKGLCTYIWKLMSEGVCTHIWSCRNQSYSHIRMDLSPRLNVPGNWLGASIPRMKFSTYIWSCRNQSYSHIKMAQHSYLTCKEPILSSWQNGSTLTSDHGRNQSSHHVRMAHRLISSL